MSFQSDLLIKNCKIVTSDSINEADIAVTNGKIVGIFKANLHLSADKVVDAKNHYVLPGIVDPHLHLQAAYYQSDQLVKTESRAAAGGGVTTIAPFWFDRKDPTLLYKQIFKRDKEMAESLSTVDFVFNGIITTQEQLEEIPYAAKEFGITSFKFFMAYTGEESRVFGVRGVDDGLVFDGMQTLRDIGPKGLFMVHTENMEVIDRFKAKLKKTGRNDLKTWSDARPWFAEHENLQRALFFAEITRTRLYVVHMSGTGQGRGVETIAAAKARGVNVICETCPHYLVFGQDDDSLIGRLGKVNPPLRDKETIAKLWWGLENGVIDCVGSDHSTIMPRTEKEKSDIWTAIPGFPGTETILPVLLSEGVNKGRLSIQRLVKVACENPARALGVYPQKGTISVGSDADFVIIDENKEVKLTMDKLHSSADYNLFEGHRFTGWPIMTILRGEVVMENGEITGKSGFGRYLPRL